MGGCGPLQSEFTMYRRQCRSIKHRVLSSKSPKIDLPRDEERNHPRVQTPLSIRPPPVAAAEVSAYPLHLPRQFALSPPACLDFLLVRTESSTSIRYVKVEEWKKIKWNVMRWNGMEWDETGPDRTWSDFECRKFVQRVASIQTKFGVGTLHKPK